MELSVDLSSAIPVVRIAGDLRLGGKQDVADEIRESLYKLMTQSQGKRRIVLNVSKVTRIDSRGIGCLARCHATAITNNTEIALVVQPGVVLDNLRQVNFIRLYPVFEDEASALANAPIAKAASPRQSP